MRIRLILSALALITLSEPLLADNFVQLNTAELLKQADWVVHGKATVEGDAASIRVIEVLHGDAPMGVIETRNIVKSTQVFVDKAEGVFFLRTSGERVFPFHPRCWLPVDEIPAVRRLRKLRADPGPLLDLEKYPEDENLTYLVGDLFQGYTTDCAEYPILANAGSWLPFYQLVPWDGKHRIVIAGRFDPAGHLLLTVEDGSKYSPLAEFYLKTLRDFATPANNVVKPFTVTVDARMPERVGTMTGEDALDYLRGRLKSEDQQVVVHALLALAKLRDLESVDQARLLAVHSDALIRLRAKQFLEWSQDR